MKPTVHTWVGRSMSNPSSVGFTMQTWVSILEYKKLNCQFANVTGSCGVRFFCLPKSGTGMKIGYFAYRKVVLG